MLIGEGWLKNRSVCVDGPICRIGRATDNDLVIEAEGIGDRHLIVCRDETGWQAVRPDRLTATSINGVRLRDGSRELHGGDEIDLAPAGAFAGRLLLRAMHDV
jgi:pSer/pThr/pTyr-binding forkhead associated (FHA) protein